MNKIMIFENEEFGKVRTVCINGEPWLVGKDVAEILGYNEPHKAIARHVDEDDGMKHPVIDCMGRTQKTTIINESGFYSLVLSSKMPNAKRFKHWVTSEVLPTIRKTGGYVDDPDKFADYYLPFADEATKQMFKIQHEYIRQLHSKINKDKPKSTLPIRSQIPPMLSTWVRWQSSPTTEVSASAETGCFPGCVLWVSL